MAASQSLSARVPGVAPALPARSPRILLSGTIVTALVLATAGAVISGYLAYQNLQDETGQCAVTHGCAAVQNSKYGKVMGIPVSVPGLALYVALAVAAGAWLFTSGPIRHAVAVLAFYGALAGVAFSAFLTYAEAYLIDAWCIYCIASASLMTGIFVAWSLALGSAIRDRTRERAVDAHLLRRRR